MTLTKSIVFHCEETGPGHYTGRDAALLAWCQSRPQAFSTFVLHILRQAMQAEQSGQPDRPIQAAIDDAQLENIVGRVVKALAIQGQLDQLASGQSAPDQTEPEEDLTDLENSLAFFATSI